MKIVSMDEVKEMFRTGELKKHPLWTLVEKPDKTAAEKIAIAGVCHYSVGTEGSKHTPEDCYDALLGGFELNFAHQQREAAINRKKIAVLAGNRCEYLAYCRERSVPESTAVWIDDINKARGQEFSAVVCTGNWFERPNAMQIREYLESRVRLDL